MYKKHQSKYTHTHTHTHTYIYMRNKRANNKGINK